MTRFAVAIWRWLDGRLGISDLIGPSLKHLIPRNATWWYVFGSATMVAFIVQVITGVALAFSYVPSAGQAYETLKFITDAAPFGHFLRGLHYYGASAMVLLIGVHIAQTFLFGSYKYPREMNWVTGVLLLGFTLAMGFSGQLLRWDQTAAWSVVVAAEQLGRVPWIGDWLAKLVLGGTNIGGATLTRFFVIHVFVIPGLLFIFIALHLWLVLRHGISEPPVPGKPVEEKKYQEAYHQELARSGVPFWPDGAWRDVVFGTGVVIAISLLAYFSGPPTLGLPPDPSILQADPRPDWYLLWYFAVLALIPHRIEGIFMIVAPLAAGFILILAPLLGSKGERHWSRRPWSIGVVVMAWLMIGSLWIVGARSPWSPNFEAKPLSVAVVGTDTGPIAHGARLFYDHACLNCHLVDGYGGRRGPDLSLVGDRLTRMDIVIRILNGGNNMPAFGNMLKPEEVDDLVAFMQSRRRSDNSPAFH
ncbi:MAG TPA: cytochrome b N-terminal domain-containing protein [Opitutaceae bacterium]|jgi:ubiquinol-cytochrome c reductase cytochrome b subunit